LKVIRVRAYREIRQNNLVLIPEGTPGEIVRTTGTEPTYYTIAFWPEGLHGVKITVPYLHQSDFVDLCGHPHRSTYADTATMPILLGIRS